MHHYILGDLLSKYSINIVFKDAKKEIFDIELAPIYFTEAALTQDQLDRLLVKYKEQPCFENINSVVFLHTMHESFEETWLGLCLEQAMIIYRRLFRAGENPMLCESPLVVIDGKPVPTDYSDYKVHEDGLVSEVDGMKHFFIKKQNITVSIKRINPSDN